MGIVQQLRCPVCSRELRKISGGLCCANRYTFDFARHGYVNLIGGRPIRIR